MQQYLYRIKLIIIVSCFFLMVKTYDIYAFDLLVPSTYNTENNSNVPFAKENNKTQASENGALKDSTVIEDDKSKEPALTEPPVQESASEASIPEPEEQKSQVAGAVLAATPGRELALYPKNFFVHMFYGSGGMVNDQNFSVLFVGSVLTFIAMFRWDDQIINFFKKHPKAADKNAWWRILNAQDLLGSGAFGFAVGVGNIAYGLAASSLYDVNAGEAQLESIAATGIYTAVMKYTVGRLRIGSNSDTSSFPSGHTSTMFATAQSVTDMYGWASIPVWLLAVYTGAYRLVLEKHHLSDVIFGATLGSIVAHSYSIYHQKYLKSDGSTTAYEKTFNIYPYYDDRNEMGLAFVSSF